MKVLTGVVKGARYSEEQKKVVFVIKSEKCGRLLEAIAANKEVAKKIFEFFDKGSAFKMIINDSDLYKAKILEVFDMYSEKPNPLCS